MPSFARSALGPLLAATIISVPLAARQASPVTAADYARAERFLAPAVTPLVIGGSVTAAWLGGDRFWYRNVLASGAEFIVVDPVKKSRTRAFDHERVAAALAAASSTSVDSANLPFQSIDLSPDLTSISATTSTCATTTGAPTARSSRSHRSRATIRTSGCASPIRRRARVRIVFDEKVATQFESRTGWQVLWATNEVIWHVEPPKEYQMR